MWVSSTAIANYVWKWELLNLRAVSPVVWPKGVKQLFLSLSDHIHVFPPIFSITWNHRILWKHKTAIAVKACSHGHVLWRKRKKKKKTVLVCVRNRNSGKKGAQKHSYDLLITCVAFEKWVSKRQSSKWRITFWQQEKKKEIKARRTKEKPYVCGHHWSAGEKGRNIHVASNQ